MLQIKSETLKNIYFIVQSRLKYSHKNSNKKKGQGKLQKVESDLKIVLKKIDSHLVDKTQRGHNTKYKFLLKLKELFIKEG